MQCFEIPWPSEKPKMFFKNTSSNARSVFFLHTVHFLKDTNSLTRQLMAFRDKKICSAHGLRFEHLQYQLCGAFDPETHFLELRRGAASEDEELFFS